MITYIFYSFIVIQGAPKGCNLEYKEEHYEVPKDESLSGVFFNSSFQTFPSGKWVTEKIKEKVSIKERVLSQSQPSWTEIKTDCKVLNIDGAKQ